MADKKKVDLKEQASQELEAMVEQHNNLLSEITERQERLNEVKVMIIEKQGYVKALSDVEQSK